MTDNEKSAPVPADGGTADRPLFSELRTIYETTAEDPHTFRLAVRLADAVDGGALRRAVELTMARYPYFCVRMCAEEDRLSFVPNPAPVPVIRTDRRIVLGGAQTGGHLMAFCYRDDWLFIDAFHGLTDGGGIAPLIRTLLHYYCSDHYGKALPADGVRLSGSPVSRDEWEDPAVRPVSVDPLLLAPKWNSPALQIGEGGLVRLIPDSVVFNLRLSEAAFMRFNISNDGSPATIAALFLTRAIDGLHPGSARPPVIAMCVNQRKALRAPLAHQSLVGDVRLPWSDRLREMPFTTQATCFRGMVSLQSNEDMVRQEIRDYQALMAHLRTLDSHDSRRACCVRRMESLSRCLTATVSYVGKSDFGEAEQYIREFHALPSTALPSTHVPLTIEMSAVNGCFFINFLQFFRERDYFDAFTRQLDQNGIDYEVLSSGEALYPRMELPF